MSVTILGPASGSSDQAMPFFSDAVQAGFPSPAADYVERRLNLNDLCIQHPAATYFLKCYGDSMEGDGFRDGDLLVVDRKLKPLHNDIVVAEIEGELTLKRLILKPRPCLKPSNPKYEPIWLDDGITMSVFGVVTFRLHPTYKR